MTTTITTRELFAGLCARLDVEPDRRGEAWIACPWCGKTGKHFSFSERGYHCFVCNARGGRLQAIADQLAAGSIIPREARPERAPRPDYWQREPERWINQYCEALDRLNRWQAYKPLSMDTIARHCLGVGRLPMYHEERRQWYHWPHRRLILPVYQAGQCVGLYGRAYAADDTHGAKWLAASGTRKDVLVGAEDVQPGQTAIWCENLVDRLLALEAAPDVAAVSTGGTGWNDGHVQQLAARRPGLVIVWLDHDLAGNCGPAHCRACRTAHQERLATWRTKHPELPPPTWEPSGPKLANALLEAGLRVRLYDWPATAPYKADLGWALMGEQGR